MRNNTYEYETITKDNNKYTYKVINNNIGYPNVEIYVNGTKWGLSTRRKIYNSFIR